MRHLMCIAFALIFFITPVQGNEMNGTYLELNVFGNGFVMNSGQELVFRGEIRVHIENLICYEDSVLPIQFKASHVSGESPSALGVDEVQFTISAGNRVPIAGDNSYSFDVEKPIAVRATYNESIEENRSTLSLEAFADLSELPGCIAIDDQTSLFDEAEFGTLLQQIHPKAMSNEPPMAPEEEPARKQTPPIPASVLIIGLLVQGKFGKRTGKN